MKIRADTGYMHGRPACTCNRLSRGETFHSKVRAQKPQRHILKLRYDSETMACQCHSWELSHPLVITTISNMDKGILTIHDILEKILCLPDRETLVSCATVNKQWSSIANKFLWRTLKSQLPLLKLMAPLVVCEDPGFNNKVSTKLSPQSSG